MYRQGRDLHNMTRLIDFSFEYNENVYMEDNLAETSWHIWHSYLCLPLMLSSFEFVFLCFRLGEGDNNRKGFTEFGNKLLQNCNTLQVNQLNLWGLG